MADLFGFDAPVAAPRPRRSLDAVAAGATQAKRLAALATLERHAAENRARLARLNIARPKRFQALAAALATKRAKRSAYVRAECARLAAGLSGENRRAVEAAASRLGRDAMAISPLEAAERMRGLPEDVRNQAISAGETAGAVVDGRGRFGRRAEAPRPLALGRPCYGDEDGGRVA